MLNFLTKSQFDIWLFFKLKHAVILLLSYITGPILESKSMRAIFQKKGKIFENLGKKCTKSENILKKCSLMRATIAHIKQLEYALWMVVCSLTD